MLREPVSGLIIQASLEALVETRPAWRSPDGAWREYRRWSGKRGVEVGLTPGEKPPYVHEFQDLVEFAIESGPKKGGDAYLRALIHHCKGNLRKITSLWEELEKVRNASR